MFSCKDLIADNIGYLQQAASLLQKIADEIYCKSTPLAYGSSASQHLRHCLEHYESFLNGRQSGKIDYDARARNARIETDRAYALALVNEIITALRRIDEDDAADRGLQVKQDSNASFETASQWSASSVQRELQFLVSHTVHHYALIAVILRLHGFEPDADFGVAPSTLKHQHALQTCAR